MITQVADEAGGFHRHGAVLLARAGDPAAPALVLQNDDFRWLQFGNGMVQSAMDLRQPERLVLPYCQWLLAALALHEHLPRRVLLLGLGGAALARFLRHASPDCELQAVEHDAAVLRLARRWFASPLADQDCHLADARYFDSHARGPFEVILCDLFDGGGMPGWVGNAAFHDRCRTALASGGWLAVNLAFADRHHRGAVLDDLRDAFDGRVLHLRVPDTDNHIALGFAERPPLCHREAIQARSRQLQAQLGLPLTRTSNALFASNPSRHGRLLGWPPG